MSILHTVSSSIGVLLSQHRDIDSTTVAFKEFIRYKSGISKQRPYCFRENYTDIAIFLDSISDVIFWVFASKISDKHSPAQRCRFKIRSQDYSIVAFWVVYPNASPKIKLRNFQFYSSAIVFRISGTMTAGNQ